MKKIVYIIILFIINIFIISNTHLNANSLNNETKYIEEIPSTIDSRIKTLIYNQNEIYDLKFYYGYQSFIELSEDEEIEIISLGESYPWKLTPIGKRLFIRPTQIGISTNMMIITTKRIYLFQISSGTYEDGADEELIYSVRFFYPDTSKINTTTALGSTSKETLKSQSLFDLDKAGNLNFDYLMTGNIQDLSPLKVFDNGINTYFEFKNKNAVVPYIYAVDIAGNESRLDHTIDGDYVVVNSTHLQFSLRDNTGSNYLLCIFNNKIIKK